jgi:hypothetical protein
MVVDYLFKLGIFACIFYTNRNVLIDNRECNRLEYNFQQSVDSLVRDKTLIFDNSSVKLYVRDTSVIRSYFVYIQDCCNHKYSYVVKGICRSKHDEYYIDEIYIDFSGQLLKNKTYNPTLFVNHLNSTN